MRGVENISIDQRELKGIIRSTREHNGGGNLHLS